MEFYIYKWLHKGSRGIWNILLVLKFELYMFRLITFLYFDILWNLWLMHCMMNKVWALLLPVKVPHTRSLTIIMGVVTVLMQDAGVCTLLPFLTLHSVLHLESHLAFHLCCSVLWAALILPLVLLSVTLSSLTISFRECQILNCRARV